MTRVIDRADRLKRTRAENAVWCALLVAVALVAIALAAWFDPEHLPLFVPQAWVLAALLLGFIAAPPRSVVTPFTVMTGVLALSYVARPLQLVYQPGAGTLSWGFAEAMLPTALWYAALLTAAVVVAYASPLGVWAAAWLPSMPRFDAASRRAGYAIGILAVATVVLYAALIRFSGLPLATVIGSPVVFRATTSTGGAFYIAGLTLWALWGVFYLVFLRALAPSSGTAAVVAAVLTFLICAALTIPFGTRGFVLTPVVVVMAILDLRAPGRITIPRLLPVVALMMIFAGAYTVYREVQTATTRTGVIAAAAQAGASGILTRSLGRFDSVDFFTWVLEAYPGGDRDFIYGRGVVDLIVQPIPRALFPAKASQTSAFLMERLLMSYDRTFTPEFGLVSELYVNGWIAGVLLGGFLLGVLTRALEHYVALHPLEDGVALFYSAAFMTPMAWFLAGFNSFGTILFVMNLMLWVIFLLGLRLLPR